MTTMDITSSACSEIAQNSANVKIEWEISEMPETDTAMKDEQKDTEIMKGKNGDKVKREIMFFIVKT